MDDSGIVFSKNDKPKTQMNIRHDFFQNIENTGVPHYLPGDTAGSDNQNNCGNFFQGFAYSLEIIIRAVLILEP